MSDARDITRALHAWERGDHGAYDALMEAAYPDLRKIARSQLRRLRPGRSLDTTGLVHETYLKLIDQTRVRANDRQHFFAIMARAMRQVLVDMARERTAQKRGGGVEPVPLDDVDPAVREDAEWILALDQTLGRLEEIDSRMVRVVECRFFSGYTEEETAAVLDLSLRTVQRTWKRARAWLRREIGGGSDDGKSGAFT